MAWKSLVHRGKCTVFVGQLLRASPPTGASEAGVPAGRPVGGLDHFLMLARERWVGLGACFTSSGIWEANHLLGSPGKTVLCEPAEMRE